MSLRIEAVEGIPEIRPGDDLAELLVRALSNKGIADGDVVAVTQKVVSKAEGRLVPGEDRIDAIARETARVVARRGELVIAETAHGFVCANAGVDASNVEPGTLALLPEDPDGSAERLRAAISGRLGARVGVVITDTFGRAWRNGLVNVAIGCAGLPAVIDLRGGRDHHGRILETTEVALADEVAAASGLVMAKAARVPVALVRGVDRGGAPDGPAADLVRAPEEDLFRTSPLQALHARRTIRSFAPGEVPREALEEAIAAACTAPAPHHTRPWHFTVLGTPSVRAALLDAMALAWGADLRGDGVPEDVIGRRIAKSDAVLGAASTLIVPWLSLEGSHAYPDEERTQAEREMFMLAGGAAVQTLLLGLSAQGLAACWISSTLFCQQEVRTALGVDPSWSALGAVACGRMSPDASVRPRPPIELDDIATFR